VRLGLRYSGIRRHRHWIIAVGLSETARWFYPGGSNVYWRIFYWFFYPWRCDSAILLVLFLKL